MRESGAGGGAWLLSRLTLPCMGSSRIEKGGACGDCGVALLAESEAPPLADGGDEGLDAAALDAAAAPLMRELHAGVEVLMHACSSLRPGGA